MNYSATHQKGDKSMKFSDILKNKHFNNLAAIIRVPFLSERWRKKHAEVPFWKMINDLDQAKDVSRTETVKHFCILLVTLTTADPRLNYAEEDLQWLVEEIDGSHGLTIASLLLAWASAPDTMLTPREVAEATGTSDSQWQNKAAAGDIPGAVKKGKQWLLPRSLLRSRGIEV